MSLKIKQLSNHTIFIIYEHTDQYFKATVSTHPDNSFTKIVKTNREEYNSYRKLYYYDGDAEYLTKFLKTFDPNSDDIEFLMACLQTHVNLHLKTSIMNIFQSWIENIYKYFTKADNCDEHKKIEYF